MRPEGWEEQVHDWNWTHYHTVECDKAYERGADAMLEGLKKEAINIVSGDYAEVKFDWLTAGTVRIPKGMREYLGPGYLVFIPEE